MSDMKDSNSKGGSKGPFALLAALVAALAGGGYYVHENGFPGADAPKGAETQPAAQQDIPLQVKDMSAAETASADKGEAAPAKKGAVTLEAPAGASEVKFDDEAAARARQEKLDAIAKAEKDADSQKLDGAQISGSLTSEPQVSAKTAGHPIVTDGFIKDLSSFLVRNYRPAPNKTGKGGKIGTGPMSANQYYGSTLNGLEHGTPDAVRGRQFILKYTFTPAAIQALTELYKKPLCSSMLMESGKKGYNAAQTAEMLTLYARQMDSVAEALDAAAKMPDLPARVQTLLTAEEDLRQTRLDFADAMIELEKAKAGNGDVKAVNAKLTAINGRISERSRAAERAQNELVASMRKTGQVRDAGTAVYIAKWVARRGPDKSEAASAAAESVREFAAAFTSTAAGL